MAGGVHLEITLLLTNRTSPLKLGLAPKGNFIFQPSFSGELLASGRVTYHGATCGDPFECPFFRSLGRGHIQQDHIGRPLKIGKLTGWYILSFQNIHTTCPSGDSNSTKKPVGRGNPIIQIMELKHEFFKVE